MKQLFRENFSKDWGEEFTIRNLPLTESKKMIESEGRQYEALSAFEVPVWRLNKINLNNRIYSEELGQKVCREFKELVTPNLADHPKDEGSVNAILAVSKNPHIREGILYVDTYIVDEEFNKKVKRMHEVGYGIGVSSSCYGELNEVTRQIKLDEFEVERWHDFVLQPSYQVYINKENTMTENVQEKPITKTVDLKENTKMNGKNSISLEEKNFRSNAKKMLTEAASVTDIKKQLEAYKEVLEYCDGVESSFAPPIVEEAQKKVTELTEQIHVLAEKGLTFDHVKEEAEAAKKDADEAKGETEKAKADAEEAKKDAEEAKKESAAKDQALLDLTKKLEATCEMLDTFKLREKKLKEMYEISVAEKNGMVDSQQYVVLQKKYEAVLSKVSELAESADQYKELARKYKRKYESQAGSRRAPVVESEVRAKRSYDNLSNIKYDEDDYNLRETSEINRFYADLYESDPRVSYIEKEIKGCKTLAEAESKYLNLKDLIERTPSNYKKLESKKEGNIVNSNFQPAFKPRTGWV